MTDRGKHRSRGLTIMELMVAVLILVMMIVAFAQILNRSQQVVSSAQRSLRKNSAAKAVLQTLRDDIRRATANGMICISQDAIGTLLPDTPTGRPQPVGHPPRLTLLTAGVTRSRTDNVVGTGSLTCLGLAPNWEDPDDLSNNTATRDILFYQRWVLDPTVGALSPASDRWPGDLSALISLPRYVTGAPGNTPNDLNDLVSYMEAAWTPGYALGPFSPSLPRMGIPATTPTQAQQLWQVLATQVEALSITWTDGIPNGGVLNWYGIDYWINDGGTPVNYLDDQIVYSDNTAEGTSPPLPNPQPKSKIEGQPWMGITPTYMQNFTSRMQYNAAGPDDAYGFYTEPTYRAMWSHHNQNNWPVAIRIRFKLAGNPEDETDPGEQYEMICQLGR